METVKCGHCGKDSGIERGENAGADAARIRSVGWKARLPILVGISEWLFACSEECLKNLRARKYAEHNVGAEAIAEADETLQRMKSLIPDMSREICRKMDRQQKRLRREKKI